jgi:hypothetical protein
MKKGRLFVSFLSYLVGTIIGLFLIITITWADMESTFYGFQRLASGGLNGVDCPAWMTRAETGTIALRLSNPTNDPIRPAVMTEISTPLVPEEFVQNIQLAPGESKKLEWTVGSENIDMRHFIFARVLVYSAHPLPSRETTCGIYVVNLPGSGRVLLPVLVTLSLLGLGWGLYGMQIWGQLNGWVSKNKRSLALFAFLILLGLVVSLTGGWMASVVVLALFLLVLTIRLGNLSGEPGRR